MSGPNASELAQMVARSLSELGEALSPVLEAVDGYRAGLVRQGYGDGLARKMAADYHAALLRMLLK